MGMFDFVKNAGETVFKTDEQAADEISKLLGKNLPGQISDLRVEFEKGTVTLAGRCVSQEAKEKAVLMAGNIKNVEKVDDERLVSIAKEDQADFYTIVRGDTLSKIAAKYYGKGSKYPVIFEANREIIKDANLIYPGQVIRIPKLKK